MTKLSKWAPRPKAKNPKDRRDNILAGIQALRDAHEEAGRNHIRGSDMPALLTDIEQITTGLTILHVPLPRIERAIEALRSALLRAPDLAAGVALYQDGEHDVLEDFRSPIPRSGEDYENDFRRI